MRCYDPNQPQDRTIPGLAPGFFVESLARKTRARLVINRLHAKPAPPRKFLHFGHVGFRQTHVNKDARFDDDTGRRAASAGWGGGRQGIILFTVAVPLYSHQPGRILNTLPPPGQVQKYLLAIRRALYSAITASLSARNTSPSAKFSLML